MTKTLKQHLLSQNIQWKKGELFNIEKAVREWLMQKRQEYPKTGDSIAENLGAKIAIDELLEELQI